MLDNVKLCNLTKKTKGHTIDAQTPHVYEIDAAECLAECHTWRLVEHDVHLSNREENEVFHSLENSMKVKNICLHIC